ncbi:MAG: GIY-YIG nuclease family protein [Bacteroidales bacterium]|nr:GIY-YIG nuclease family protein [Bacteroidales bacterium]
MNKRSTYKYVLKDGNKIKYVGITDDPQRRESEHKRDKDFKKMEIIGRAVSRESAEKWETERINQYRRNHNGQVPPLNKTLNGK